MNILIMGPAGSGKGTMSAKIAEAYNVAHISTGDMFRAAMKEGSELGLTAKKFIDQGKLVPDDITIALVRERLAQPDCQGGYLLDGYPRTLNQAHAFDEITADLSCPVTAVVNLTVEFDELAKRITGRRLCKTCGAIYHITNFPPKREGICDACDSPLIQRSDDTEEQLRVRLVEHQQNTEPVLEFYRDKGLVKDVNASQGIEDVWADVQRVLGDIQ